MGMQKKKKKFRESTCVGSEMLCYKSKHHWTFLSANVPSIGSFMPSFGTCKMVCSCFVITVQVDQPIGQSVLKTTHPLPLLQATGVKNAASLHPHPLNLCVGTSTMTQIQTSLLLLLLPLHKTTTTTKAEVVEEVVASMLLKRSMFVKMITMTLGQGLQLEAVSGVGEDRGEWFTRRMAENLPTHHMAWDPVETMLTSALMLPLPHLPARSLSMAGECLLFVHVCFFGFQLVMCVLVAI